SRTTSTTTMTVSTRRTGMAYARHPHSRANLTKNGSLLMCGRRRVVSRGSGDEADLAGRRRADLHVRDLGDLGEVGLAGAIDQLEDALPRGDAGGNGGGQLRAALRPRDVQLAGVVNESDGDV